jgi:hypothetical protein
VLLNVPVTANVPPAGVIALTADVINVPLVGSVTPVVPVIVNVNAYPPNVVIELDAASVIPGTTGAKFNFAAVIFSAVAQVYPTVQVIAIKKGVKV